LQNFTLLAKYMVVLLTSFLRRARIAVASRALHAMRSPADGGKRAPIPASPSHLSSNPSTLRQSLSSHGYHFPVVFSLEVLRSHISHCFYDLILMKNLQVHNNICSNCPSKIQLQELQSIESFSCVCTFNKYITLHRIRFWPMTPTLERRDVFGYGAVGITVVSVTPTHLLLVVPTVNYTVITFIACWVHSNDKAIKVYFPINSFFRSFNHGGSSTEQQLSLRSSAPSPCSLHLL
jgi:hypothetical protein